MAIQRRQTSTLSNRAPTYTLILLSAKVVPLSLSSKDSNYPRLHAAWLRANTLSQSLPFKASAVWFCLLRWYRERELTDWTSTHSEVSKELPKVSRQVKVRGNCERRAGSVGKRGRKVNLCTEEQGDSEEGSS